ncbi:hypothetical protein AAFF_G00251920 [Aldrovandia affinis]|uniref:Ig-like domain-containing protein n=1 Tax=Aldrovandia affinis TaxID=143900 RepID=A0AAD7STI0_9TELE|nr:hypothetical protein AAFF_G00251920 [Aldrovandia affinis]
MFHHPVHVRIGARLQMLKSKGVRMPALDSRTLTAVFCALAVYLNAGVTMAMRVTSTGPQTIQKAQGETVTLGCTYTPDPHDMGELDIEWSLVSPDMTQKDTLILSFAGGRTWIHGDPSLTKGLDFSAVDPSLGDGSISISKLEVSHTGTYQCKVKRAPGVDMRKVTLMVMVRPSVPKCRAEGSQSVGGAVSLHCKSSQGSPPLKYTWTKEGAAALQSGITQNSLTGELRISNHSEMLAGTYRCVASNGVGTEQCRYALRAEKPPNRAGVIVGTVVGVLLLVIIVVLLICVLIRQYQKRCKDKEVANEIREDSPPPASRAQSRISAFRSGVAYSSVTTPPPWAESEFSSDLTDATKALQSPSSNGAGAPAARQYDSSAALGSQVQGRRQPVSRGRCLPSLQVLAGIAAPKIHVDQRGRSSASVRHHAEEDSPPPASRAQSRISAFRSGVAYSSVTTPPGRSQSSAVTSQSATKALQSPSSNGAGLSSATVRQQVRPARLEERASVGLTGRADSSRGVGMGRRSRFPNGFTAGCGPRAVDKARDRSI